MVRWSINNLWPFDEICGMKNEFLPLTKLVDVKSTLELISNVRDND